MSETTINETFFWNGDRYYGQDELEIMTDSFMCSGVRIRYDGTMDLKPSLSSSGLSIYLEPGDALSGGHWFHLETRTPYSPTASQCNKKCALFIRTDWSNKTTSPVIVAGTSSTAPSPTRDWGNIYDIEICTFYAGPSGVCTDLKDKRTDGTVCGGIRARGNSELDEYLAQATDQFENWFNTTLSTSGWVQIYAQKQTPSNAAIGSVWVDNGNWQIKKKEKANFWQTVCCILPYHIYGIRMNADHVFDTTINYLPYNVVREGFVADSTQCNYARYVGNGKSAISKAGLYLVSATLNISDQANLQKFNFQLWKQDAKNFVKVGEDMVDMTDVAATKTKGVGATMNITVVLRCLKDEVIYASCVPHQASKKYKYRVASVSSVTIVPIKIF